jgi:hypothetical protein
MVVGVPWIREGTALAQDPWTLNSPETFANVGVLDEGLYLGSASTFNFRGQNVEVTISGSAVDVFITGSSGGGIALSQGGVLLGTPTSLNISGELLVASVTGSNGYLEGNNWADRIPITGSIYDLEFNGPNGDYSQIDHLNTGTITKAMMDINYRWPSWFHVYLPASATSLDLGKQVSKGSGTSSAFDFSLTLKGTNCPSDNYRATHIFIGDLPPATIRHGYRVGFEGASNTLGISKITNGSWSYNFGNMILGRTNTIYLHFQRTAGVNYGFGSTDGMSWFQLHTGDSLVFDAKWFCGQLLGAGPVRAHAGFDWMRVNHLNLLV